MRRILLIIGLVCLIAVMIIVTVISLNNTPVKIYKLTNGVEVELLGTAVGSATFTTEKPWHKRARKILPAAWQSWIPATTAGSCSSGTNSITVYLRVTKTNATSSSSQGWDSYTTSDDTGFVYQREGGSCTIGGNAFQMHGVILRTFPRRQPRFKLQLLDSNEAVLAVLDIENPVRGPFAEWTSLPLPQTRSNGPVTLSLLSLQEGGDKNWHYIQPTWHSSSTDPQWSKARVKYATFVDSTGNEGQWLSPREKAWKVRATVARQQLKDFSPTEYASVTNVPIPEPGESTLSRQTFDRNGVTLIFHAIAGPGQIVRTNRGSWQMATNSQAYTGHSTSSDSTTTIEKWGSIDPFMLVEIQGSQPNDDFIFDLRDDQGKSIEVKDSHGYDGSSGGGRLYLRDFKPPKNAKSLNLTVIVNRPLEFEFMVNPADVKPAKSELK